MQAMTLSNSFTTKKQLFVRVRTNSDHPEIDAIDNQDHDEDDDDRNGDDDDDNNDNDNDDMSYYSADKCATEELSGTCPKIELRSGNDDDNDNDGDCDDNDSEDDDDYDDDDDDNHNNNNNGSDDDAGL